MLIVNYKFKWPRLERPLRIYLAQMLGELDPHTKKLRNVAIKEEKINSVLDLVSSKGESFSILVFPEIALPGEAVERLVGRIRNLPPWTILIIGIELISVARCRSLALALGIKRKELFAAMNAAQDDQRVNACLLAFKGQGDKLELLLQPKITHSKFQGDLDEVANLAQSFFVYRLYCQDVFSFAVVICSDFFNRKAGEMARIVDTIDYEVLKKGSPLDFIFNVQYNPAPNSPLFLHGLQRLYDDGLDGHGRLCTIFLNSVLEGERHGGLSKVMFHRKTRLSTTQPIRQLDAPVVGYELQGGETLLRCTFDHLPRFWEPERDPQSIHFDSWAWSGQSWEKRQRCDIGYVMPIEKEEIRSIGDYETVAGEFSRLGKFEQSITWAKRAVEHWKKEKRHGRAAQNLRMIASDFRHQGQFNYALQAYAEAESLARSEQTTPDSRFLLSRIRAGRVMVEKYLLSGQCAEADQEYGSIMGELVGYISMVGAADYGEKVNLYSLHALRQQAEMRRILGRYQEALELFSQTYVAYEYRFHEEKANSALGMAESLRMLELYDKAREKFTEVMEYAKTHGNRRLFARALRPYTEIGRILGQEVDEQIAELGNISDSINYLFGRIWRNLLAGGSRLTCNPEESQAFFVKARELTTVDGSRLAIEYAYSLIGSAEAERLTGRRASGEVLFRDALKIYRSCGIVWGVLRSQVGLSLCADEMIDLGNLRIESPGDLRLYERAQSRKLDPNETLFWNMP
ncbi:MAG TPA: tetratricopeptide repeat protein [Thermoanaerobaculia bacterium]|nr:tetratricopeptide repeat protein [Thermoanaerobaculia bacterium]